MRSVTSRTNPKGSRTRMRFLQVGQPSKAYFLWFAFQAPLLGASRMREKKKKKQEHAAASVSKTIDLTKRARKGYHLERQDTHTHTYGALDTNSFPTPNKKDPADPPSYSEPPSTLPAPKIDKLFDACIVCSNCCFQPKERAPKSRTSHMVFFKLTLVFLSNMKGIGFVSCIVSSHVHLSLREPENPAWHGKLWVARAPGIVSASSKVIASCQL